MKRRRPCSSIFCSGKPPFWFFFVTVCEEMLTQESLLAMHKKNSHVSTQKKNWDSKIYIVSLSSTTKNFIITLQTTLTFQFESSLFVLFQKIHLLISYLPKSFLKENLLLLLIDFVSHKFSLATIKIRCASVQHSDWIPNEPFQWPKEWRVRWVIFVSKHQCCQTYWWTAISRMHNLFTIHTYFGKFVHICINWTICHLFLYILM